MPSFKEKIEAAAAFVRGKDGRLPYLGLILGSGLGDLAEQITSPLRIPFAEIPHFPVSTVSGHEGVLILGELEGKLVAALKGRIHYYEGYAMDQVTFPVRLFKALGASCLLVTNACGGLRPDMRPGDLMLIQDHINLMGANPLIGPNDETLGTRFPDMSDAYSHALRELAQQVARQEQIPLTQGVFAAVSGPNYETAAEIEMIRRLGGDAVGMSTVPEVIVAAHGGLKVLGISCVTDVVSVPVAVSHEEVLAVANAAKPRFLKLMRALIKAM